MTLPFTPAVFGMCCIGDLFSITCIVAAARLAWRNYHPEGPTMLANIRSLIAAIFTPKARLTLYGVTIAVLALLVYYRIVEAAAVPLWLALAAAVLGLASPTTAAATLAAQLRAGKQ